MSTAWLSPADGNSPAEWILASNADWQSLVRYGPPGFDTYLRIRLGCDSDPISIDQAAFGIKPVLRVLSHHTNTPLRAFAAIWDGSSELAAPIIDIPHRPMRLFTGPVNLLHAAQSAVGTETVNGQLEPNLVWPEDRAWCVALDVDEVFEFSVGCSLAAAQALRTIVRSGIREVSYGT